MVQHRLRSRLAALATSLVLASCSADSARLESTGSSNLELDEGANESESLVVTGGTVVTLDDSDTVIESGAVAVVEGRIAAVGTEQEIRQRFPEAREISAGGGIIMPGLVNTHTHIPMTLFRGLADDLELMDWLENHIFPAEAAFVDEEFVRWGTKLACLEMLRGGTTTFVDMYFFEDEIAEEVDRCGMRALLSQTLFDFPAPDNQTWEETISAIRVFVDRWRDHPRITPVVAPHAPYTVSGEHLVEAFALATELDVPMNIHLAEDEDEVITIKEKTGMTSVQYVDSLGILDDRVIAAHMVWPTVSEIEILAANAVGIAHCPQSNMKVSAGIAPVPEMIAAGVAVGLGTDGTASNNDLNLWEEIDTAAKLHKVDTLDPTVIPARTALRMATIDGARAIGLEDQIGSLEVGKWADLIVVGTDGIHQQPYYDVYSLLVYSTKASDVRLAMVAGQVLMQDGEVLTVDAERVLAKAWEYQGRIAANAAQQ
jgi:5-methylthioadenosine/S-adenosylhomocysteine deaminase